MSVVNSNAAQSDLEQQKSETTRPDCPPVPLEPITTMSTTTSNSTAPAVHVLPSSHVANVTTPNMKPSTRPVFLQGHFLNADQARPINSVRMVRLENPQSTSQASISSPDVTPCAILPKSSPPRTNATTIPLVYSGNVPRLISGNALGTRVSSPLKITSPTTLTGSAPTLIAPGATVLSTPRRMIITSTGIVNPGTVSNAQNPNTARVCVRAVPQGVNAGMSEASQLLLNHSKAVAQNQPVSIISQPLQRVAMSAVGLSGARPVTLLGATPIQLQAVTPQLLNHQSVQSTSHAQALAANKKRSRKQDIRISGVPTASLSSLPPNTRIIPTGGGAVPGHRPGILIATDGSNRPGVVAIPSTAHPQGGTAFINWSLTSPPQSTRIASLSTIPTTNPSALKSPQISTPRLHQLMQQISPANDPFSASPAIVASNHASAGIANPHAMASVSQWVLEGTQDGNPMPLHQLSAQSKPETVGLQGGASAQQEGDERKRGRKSPVSAKPEPQQKKRRAAQQSADGATKRKELISSVLEQQDGSKEKSGKTKPQGRKRPANATDSSPLKVQLADSGASSSTPTPIKKRRAMRLTESVSQVVAPPHTLYNESTSSAAASKGLDVVVPVPGRPSSRRNHFESWRDLKLNEGKLDKIDLSAMPAALEYFDTLVKRVVDVERQLNYAAQDVESTKNDLSEIAASFEQTANEELLTLIQEDSKHLRECAAAIKVIAGKHHSVARRYLEAMKERGSRRRSARATAGAS